MPWGWWALPETQAEVRQPWLLRKSPDRCLEGTVLETPGCGPEAKGSEKLPATARGGCPRCGPRVGPRGPNKRQKSEQARLLFVVLCGRGFAGGTRAGRGQMWGARGPQTPFTRL